MGTETFVWGERDEDRFDEGAHADISSLVNIVCQDKRDKGELTNDKTLNDYRCKIARALNAAMEEGCPPQRWGHRRAKWYVGQLRAAGLSDRTALDAVVKLKNFFKHLHKMKLFPKNLLEGFDNPKVRSERDDLVSATHDDLDALIRANTCYYDHCQTSLYSSGPGRAYHVAKDGLGILLAADTAMRPIEICRLRRNQIQSDEFGYYIVLTKAQTKSGKPRKVYLSEETVTYGLLPWLEIRDHLKFQSGVDQGWLLCTQKEDANGNQNLDPEYWSRGISRKIRYAKDQGWIAADKNITLYSLRRYAQEQINRRSVRASMAIAGHSAKSGLAVHARYDKSMSLSELETLDNAQIEAETRIAHQFAYSAQSVHSF